MKALVVLMLLVATARAESVEILTRTARNVASDGRCEALPAIAARVRALDPDYYARVYALDPVIAGCTHVDARLVVGLPPSLTPPRAIVPLRDRAAPKSPDAALALSLGFTAGGVGLTALSGSLHAPWLATAGVLMAIVGPTTGHIYADDTFNGGLGVRTAGAVAGLLGFGLALSCYGQGCSRGTGYVAGGLLLGGGIAYVAGSLYEIGTAPSAAQRYNRDHGLEMTVVPTGNGLALAGRF